LAGEEFTIETKLKIAGVEAKGDLDAGTLKFKVDTTALKKLVKDAKLAAQEVKATLSDISLKKIEISINQNSLKSFKTQIRDAITASTGKVKLGVNLTSLKSFSSTIRQSVQVALESAIQNAFTKGAPTGGIGASAVGTAVAAAGPGGGAFGAATKIKAGDINAVAQQLSGPLSSALNKVDELGDKTFADAFNINQLDAGVKLVGASLQRTLGKALLGVGQNASEARRRVKLLIELMQELQTAMGRRPQSAERILGDTIASQRKAAEKAVKADEKSLSARIKLAGRAQNTVDSIRLRGQKKAAQINAAIAADTEKAQDRGRIAQRKAAEEHIKNLQRVRVEAQRAFEAQQKVFSRLGGGGVGGGAGGGPPGAFGGPPLGAGGDPRKIAAAAKEMKSLSRFTKRAAGDMQTLELATFQVGRKALAFRGVAIAINTTINALQGSAKFVLDFNANLLELNKILQFSAQGITFVGDRLFALAKQTGVALDQTFEIATAFARAGLEGRGYGSIAQLTETALRGLQGTTLEATAATQIMIQVIQQVEAGARGLNKELITTGQLFDILGRAEDITASKASDVGQAFRRAGASLLATGTTISEVTALISVLQERTQRGGEVIGTALKTLAARTSNSASEASKALKSIGVTTIDTEGKLRNTFDVLKDIAVAFRGLTEAEQANIAVKVAGVRQIEIFRSALLDFNRVIDVNNTLQTASGDAARKQAVEQQKLLNIIQRIKTGLIEFVKSAAEGPLGKLFSTAIRSAEQLLKIVNSLDNVFGGLLSSVAAFAAAARILQTVRQLIAGMLAAARAFIATANEMGTGLQKTGTAAQIALQSGINPMNAGLEAGVSTIERLNQRMASFITETEAAAAATQRLAAARTQARSEIAGAGGIGGKTVNVRTQEILRQQEQPARTARRVAIARDIKAGKAGELQQLGQAAPGFFSPKEQAVINKATAREAKKAAAAQGFFNRTMEGTRKVTNKLIGGQNVLSKTFRGAGRALDFVNRNQFKVSIGAGLLSVGLDKLEQEALKAGNATAAMTARMGSFAAQGLQFGALFGPWGAAIGTVGGALLGLFSASDSAVTGVEKLQKELLKLEVITTNNGRLTDTSAAKLEKFNKTMNTLADFSATQIENAAKASGDPQIREAQEKIRESMSSAASSSETIRQELQAVVALLPKGATKEEKGKAVQEQFGRQLSEFFGTGQISFEALFSGAEQVGDKFNQALFDQTVEFLRKATEDKPALAAALEDELRKTAVFTNEAARKALSDAIAEGKDLISRDARRLIQLAPGLGGLDVEGAGSGGLQGIIQAIQKGQLKPEEIAVARQEGIQQIAFGDLVPEAQISESIQRFTNLVDQATKLTAQQERFVRVTGGSKFIFRLEKLFGRVGDGIVESSEKATAEEVRANREQRRIETARALSGTFRRRRRGVEISGGELPDLAAGLKIPVSELEIALREFSTDFAKRIIELKDANIAAFTAQKDAASERAESARDLLKIIEQRRGRVVDDAVAAAGLALQKLVPSLANPEGLQGEDAAGAQRTFEQQRQAFVDTLVAAQQEIRTEGIINPDEIRARLDAALGAFGTDLGRAFGPKEGKPLIDLASELVSQIDKADLQRLQDITKARQAELAEVNKIISKINEETQRRRELNAVLALEDRIATIGLTGIRKLTAERELSIKTQEREVGVIRERIAKTDAEIARVKEEVQTAGARKDALENLEKSRAKDELQLRKQVAQSNISSIKTELALSKERLSVAGRVANTIRQQTQLENEVVDLLNASSNEMDKFNRKLQTNAQQFSITRAELVNEFQEISNSALGAAEKEARLVDVRQRAKTATLQAVKAEAEVIAQRRQAVQQVSSELLQNQDQLVQQQKAVIDATKGVSDAYESYVDAASSSTVATAEYRIGLQLAEMQARRITGSFAGIRDEIDATANIFGDMERTIADLGAGERALVEIRRQSIDQQLSLFNQLLSEQSSLARNFFQSSAQDQSELFRGIQEARGVADILGGSFDNFRKLGEKAINDLGTQLLNLPQETRQRVVQSLETLRSVGGTVGGFTADELLTAIETASLGVGGDSLAIDPLFQVQEKIAELTQEQARLQTEQLLAAQEQLIASKESLGEAQAQKDLAEIQLERIQEEGTQLRSKLGELQGGLQTAILTQDANNRNGQQVIASAIGITNDLLRTGSSERLSVKFTEAIRAALGTGGSGASSRGSQSARDQRQSGTNDARNRQMFNESGQAVNSMIIASNASSQNTRSNIGEGDDLQSTNRKLGEINSQLTSLLELTVAGNEIRVEIRDQGDATTGGIAGEITPVEVIINGEQTITVTGFEEGVTRIATALAQSLGVFTTEEEARQIAEAVLFQIRRELENRGIVKPNQQNNLLL